MEHAADVFSKGKKVDEVPSVKDLHAMIRQFPMENYN
jgi:hypothetical protein